MLDTAPWNLLDTWFDTRWLDTAWHAFNTGAWDLVSPAYAEEGYDIIPEASTDSQMELSTRPCSSSRFL